MRLIRRDGDSVEKRLDQLRAAIRASKGKDWSSSAYERERELAFRVIELGEPAVGPLLEALHDPDIDVRDYAAIALSRAPNVEARVEALVSAASRVPLGNIQETTAGIVEFGDEALEPLLRALKSDNTNVRGRVSDAIARLGPGVVDRLVSLLDDPDPHVRSELVSALGEIADARALPHLVARLEDSDDDVRWQAAWNLRYLKDGAAVQPLVQALESDANSLNIRRAADGTLRDLGWTPETTEQAMLVSVLDLDPTAGRGSPRERLERVVAYGSAAVDLLLYALESGDRSVREEAATALGEIGDPRARDALGRAATADDWFEVRNKAEFALSKLGAGTSLPLATRISDSKLAKPTREMRLADRRGKCKTCGSIVDLLDATEEQWDWDGVDAHVYFCSTCYVKGDIYTGRLLDRLGEDFIDQYSSR